MTEKSSSFPAKRRTMVPILLLLVPLALFPLYVNIRRLPPKSDGNTLSAGDTFSIGTLDQSADEFVPEGAVLAGVRYFSCLAGSDCSSKSFPMRIVSAATRGTWDDRWGTVEQITIRFTIDQTVDDTVFRMSRDGAETALIIVDGCCQRHLVTAESIGSDEERFGQLVLPLGKLPRGDHWISVGIAPDSPGNGSFSIDAIQISGVGRRRT